MQETHTEYGYKLAVKHLRERLEAGQTFQEAVEGMEKVYEDVASKE